MLGNRGLRIGIVDNDVLTLGLLDKGLRDLFGNDAVQWATGDGHKAIELCSRESDCPHVLVLDMSLEDISGVDVCRCLRERSARPAIVGLTSFSPTRYSHQLAEAGGQALVVKARIGDLGRVIRAVATGDPYPNDGSFMTADQAHRKLKGTTVNPVAELTSREASVMDLVAFGMTNAQIAEELGLGLPTVKTHLHNAMRKLGAANRTSAMSIWLAFREGER